MPNGLLQGDWGDVLNSLQFAKTPEALAIQRLVTALTNPLNVTQQIQIVSNSATGPVIDMTVGTNTPPQAIGLQVGQGGPRVVLGVGNTSQGVVANCLNNRDIHQTLSSDTISRFTAAATNRPVSKTATGLATSGLATGKPSSDKGTMTAGPGETMPNATVSGYQKVATNNFEYEGLLTSNLAAATNGLTGATTATLQTWVVDPANAGHLKNGPIVTVSNRDMGLSLVSGTYIQAKYVNGEIRPVWAAC